MDMETLNLIPVKFNKVKTEGVQVKSKQEVWSGELLLGTIQKIDHGLGWVNKLPGYSESEIFTTRKKAVHDLKKRVVFITN